MISKNKTNLFWGLAIASVVAMLTANITAFKMVQLGSFTLPAAVFIFPITYILSDVIVEVYGMDNATTVIKASFIANAVMAAYFMFAIALPAPVWFEGSDAFATVLGSTPRVLAAGLAAFAVGSFVNVSIMARLRGIHGERLFALRAIVSTIFGEGIDAIIFITVAFLGTMPVDALVTMIVTQAVFKIVYEVLILPVTTVVKNKVREAENFK